MTFIKELRGAVRRSENLATRCQLAEHADQIDALVIELYRTPTAEALRRLTAEWTRAYWTLDRALPRVGEKVDGYDVD